MKSASRGGCAYYQVYYKIPTRQLIEGCAAAGRGGDDGVVGGRSLSDRLAEPGCLETRLVALRLLGSVSARDFADSVQGCGGRVRSREDVLVGCSVFDFLFNRALYTRVTLK